MKIILREHVEHLGDRGEIVNVAAGYARNYLLPKGKAFEATPGNIKQIELRRKVWEVREAREVKEFKAVAARIEALQLRIEKKAGESGTLYGSVTTAEIADLMASRGVEIDRKRLVLAEPIKELGTYHVTAKIHHRVSADVKIEVVSEEAPE